MTFVICGGNPPTIHQRGDTVKQSVYENILENQLYQARLKYASAILLSHQGMGDAETNAERAILLLDNDAETAIRLLDEALDLVPDLLDAYSFREELWHTVLVASKYKFDQKSDYDIYLQSPAWKGKREQAMNRDDHRCASCNNSAEVVHHKTYDNIGKEPLDDLTSLCDRCHEEFHESREVDNDLSAISAAIGEVEYADPTESDIFQPSSNNDEMEPPSSPGLVEDDPGFEDEENFDDIFQAIEEAENEIRDPSVRYR